MGGLTIQNNFFILKIEKTNKILVFDLFLSRDFAYLSAELTDFDEVPDNSNKRSTSTVSSDSMREKTRLQF